MSLLTQAYLLEQYGPRLNLDQLATLLEMKKNTIYNKVAMGTFEVKTYVDGGRRFADYRDVSEHLDECRRRAKDST